MGDLKRSLKMKYLLVSITLTLSSFAAAQKAAPAVERNCTFLSLPSQKEHQIICRWTETEADGSFLLAIEPGCILLKVKEEKFTDEICRLRILGSPAGQPVVDFAKKNLGITSNLFEIFYRIQKQEVEGMKLPAYNMIIKIKDSGKSEQVTKPMKQKRTSSST